VDLTQEPIGNDRDGKPVYLSELWPSDADIEQAMSSAITPSLYTENYRDPFAGDARWQSLPIRGGATFDWDEASLYIRRPPFFEAISLKPAPLTDILGARALAVLGDSVTTDHISPVGAIAADSPAGRFLRESGVAPKD